MRMVLFVCRFAWLSWFSFCTSAFAVTGLKVEDNWSGQVMQGDLRYPVEMNFWRTKYNNLLGVVLYPSLDCSAKLMLQENTSQQASFVEVKLKGAGCVSGMIKLVPADSGQLSWKWFYLNGKFGAESVVYHSQPSAQMITLRKSLGAPASSVAQVGKKTNSEELDKQSTKPMSGHKQENAVLDNQTIVLQPATAKKNSSSSRGDAVTAYTKKDFQATWKLAHQLKPNLEAQYTLGIMYYYGQGVEKNLKLSALRYTRAAVQGHANAQYNLGMMFKNGDGVVKNPALAEVLFEKAAKQGHVNAKKQQNLMIASRIEAAKIAEEKKPRMPKTLNNFYSIGPRGDVTLMKGSNERLASYREILSKYAKDAGLVKGRELGFSIYAPKEAVLVVHDYIPRYRIQGKLQDYCNELKLKAEVWQIKPYVLPDGNNATDVWQTTGGVCLSALFSKKRCEEVKCIKYNYEKHTVTSNRQIALEISQKNKLSARTLKTYAEVKKEIDSLPTPSIDHKGTSKRTPKQTRKKGYFEYNGNCGLNSCSNEDTMRIIEDYYTPRY